MAPLILSKVNESLEIMIIILSDKQPDIAFIVPIWLAMSIYIPPLSLKPFMSLSFLK